MIDFKEYTKLRDIAQKRIKRGQAAGLAIDVHIPTVKELRNYRDTAQEIELMRLQQFLETGFSLERRRQAEHPRMTPEERQERRRKQSRRYRRNKVAREYEKPEHPDAYRRYVKGLETLGVDIKPSDLPAFFAYMDYRFAQGKSSQKYLFDIFVEDYMKMLTKGYSPGDIINDFEKFEADQALLSDDADNMLGTDYEQAIKKWDEFIGN